MAKKLDQKILAGFVRETRLYLPEIRQGLNQFYQDVTQREALDEALGYAHTIKGASLMVGFPALSQLAGCAEETLQQVAAGTRAIDPPCLTWCEHVLEQIEQYLEGLLAGDAEQPALVAAVLQEFRDFQGLSVPGEAPAAPAGPAAAEESVAAAAVLSTEMRAEEALLSADEDDFSVELLSETVEEDAAALEAQEQAQRQAAALAASPSQAAASPPAAAESLEELMRSIDQDVQRVYGHEAAATVAPGGREVQAARYILFTLAGSRYAVPVPSVLEIGRVPPITPVPNVPPWVRGVINLRGEILSVIDFRTFLGLEDSHASEHSRMLVVKTAGDEIMTSLIVDQITGIVPLSGTLLDLPATVASHPVASYLCGAYEHEDQVGAVFDLERLLLSPEVRQFD
ncbi:MAG: chemotaxis protein CheW [Candidatus Tectimicrobiota bacterium]